MNESQKQIYDTFLTELKKQYVLVPRVLTYKDERITKNAVFVKEIINFVCDYYKLEIEYVLSDMRRRPYPDIRKIIAYLAHRYGDHTMSVQLIGACLNNKDHATVLYSVRIIKERIQYDKNIRKEIEELELEFQKKFNLKPNR